MSGTEVSISIKADDQASDALSLVTGKLKGIADTASVLSDKLATANTALATMKSSFAAGIGSSAFATAISSMLESRKLERISAGLVQIEESIIDLKGISESTGKVWGSIFKVLTESGNSMNSGTEEASRRIIETVGTLEKLTAVIKENMQDMLEGMSFDLDTVPAVEALGELEERVSGLVFKGLLHLDTSNALSTVSALKARIDSIPDVSVKTVIVRVQTQASPVRPFSEGMDYVEERLRSLPSSTDHTIRILGQDIPAASISTRQAAHSMEGVTFSPTMHVHVSGPVASSGRALAREIDQELSELWRSNRSELRRTMAG